MALDHDASCSSKSGAEIKQEVQDLLQQAQEKEGQTASCHALIQQTERLLAQWQDSLFNCYDIPALPPNNAKLESRFNRLRSAQRRISGQKKTTPLRRDAHLRLLLQANSKEELLEPFRRVPENAYLRARFRVEAAEEPRRQLARLRRKPYQTASALIAEYLALCKQDNC